jgi:hypothetical protein
MLARLLTVILSIFLSLHGHAQGPTDFEYGARPPLAIFDPSGILEPEVVKEISTPLAELHKKEGIDVIVVILTDLKQAPPDHVARQFARAWCESASHCVVLHVPGREDSPWIVPAGKLIDHLKQDQLEQSVAAARRRAASESSDPNKVRAAATEAADMLRYWVANARNRSEMIQTTSTRVHMELETQSRRWKVAALIAAASAIPVIAGIYALVVVRRRRGPRYFPDQAYQPRLGAPYAGGNHAVANLGSPLP